MAILFQGVMHAKRILSQSKFLANKVASVPKGFIAIYVGESQKKRFIVPFAVFHQPPFQELLTKAEEEFGFDHSMGGLTLPCREDTFLDIITGLKSL